ncbi:c-type cytochrome [Pseudothauera rhizosphaerae]|uniref:c-type cytochrome n=1 Tax=Pseudothauera rhizosphaerae TaxID=2565932 RepID=UPI001E49BEEA|nr:c-type cytochrome [Pseudothauera rhizosphaerae]
MNGDKFRKIAALALLGALPAASALAQPVGDAARGRELVEQNCIACHGVDGNGPVPSFPKVAGLHYEYTIKQLHEFQGKRRPSEIMQPIAAVLTEQQVQDVALYFASQRAVPVDTVDASLLPLGRKLYEDGNSDSGVPACAGCHGTEGRGNARFPRLAGQFQEYVVAQIQQFAEGKRTNDKRMMQVIANRLTAEEVQAVAHYIASMP